VPRLLLRILPLLAFLLVLLPQSEAQARRGIVVVTSGDSITHVADLDPAVADEIEAEAGSGIAVGFKYEQFGLFWLEVWCWDGEYVLFRGEEYWDLPPDELMAAAGVTSFDELPKPWSYTFPPGLIAVGVLGIGFVIVALVSKGDDDDDDDAEDEDEPEVHDAVHAAAALNADPRYQQALQLYNAHPTAPPEQRVQWAVAKLAEFGVPDHEARHNMAIVLQAQAQQAAFAQPKPSFAQQAQAAQQPVAQQPAAQQPHPGAAQAHAPAPQPHPGQPPQGQWGQPPAGYAQPAQPGQQPQPPGQPGQWPQS